MKSDLSQRIAGLSPQKRELLLRLLDKDHKGAPAEIRPRNRETNTFPLSFGQQRLWFLDQAQPGSPFYNLPMAVRIRGALDASVLQRSLNEIVRRHETLRTTFQTIDGVPKQIVAADLDIPLPVIELRESDLTRVMSEEATLPFNLAEGPLLRTSLVRLGPEEHVFLFTIHHIVSDGWSTGVFVHEMAALCDAFSSGKPSPLPGLPVQYADYALWQREWLQGEVLDSQLAYWKQQLADLPILDLHTDRPRPAVQSFRGHTRYFTLPPSLTVALRALTRQEGATLLMTLLAVFQALLYRYTGQVDIVVGSGIANRNRIETEGLIGFFVNMLAIRTDLSGNPTFRELLGRVRSVAVAGYEHQDLPFEQLVDELQPQRDLSRHPLFQVAFVLQNMPVAPIDLRGLSLSPIPLDAGSSRFDLTLYMAETADALGGAIEYNTDLFQDRTITRLLNHFECLLEEVAANPDRRLTDVPLLTNDEQRQLLVDWNNTARLFPSEACVHRLFEQQVERTPEAIAVVSSGRQLTYRQLNEHANRLAHHLQSLGVGPDSIVGIRLDRSVELIIALLAVLKAGGAYLPLDSDAPQARTDFMLADAGVVLVLSEGDVGAAPSSPLSNPSSAVTGENLAYVIYTSGSTGQPKAVAVPHAGLANLVGWHRQEYGVTAADRATQLAGLSFDASVWEVWPYLVSGASLYLVEETLRMEPAGLVEWLAENQITLSFLPTPLAESVLGLEWPEETALRTLLTGGDRLHRGPERAMGFAVVNHYGPTESSVVTTCTPVQAGVVAPPIGRPIANTRVYVLDAQMGLAAVGVPGELYIAGRGLARGYLNRADWTAERFVPDPFAEEAGGRLYRTGDRVRWNGDGDIEFIGRIDQQVKVRGFRIELGEVEAALTEHPGVKEAAVIVADDRRLVAYVVADFERFPSSAEVVAERFEASQLPALAQGGVDATSIECREASREAQARQRAASRADGADGAVRSNHRLIGSLEPTTPSAPAEEASRHFPTGASTPPWAKEGSLLAINGSATASAKEGSRELRSYLQSKLPEYMLPSAFVFLDALPLSPSGKVDRHALPPPTWEDIETTAVAPRNPVEEVIAGLFSDVLGIDRIGIHTNFFELGGHSLLATQVVSRVRATFNIELPLRSLFEAPTVAGLAASVQAVRRTQLQIEAPPPLLPTPRHGSIPLSFAQQRLWFLNELEPGLPAYNILSAVRIDGPLQPAVLQRSINEVIRRHESLRTTFAAVDGRGMQVIAPELIIALPTVDLNHLPTEQREQEIRRLATEEAQRRFDLTTGPLIRTALVESSEDEHVLFLTIHHIIADGWSMGVFLREIVALYPVFAAGLASPLPDLSIQYAEFAIWQRKWLQGHVLESELAYWKRQLSNLPQLQLPADRPRPAVQSFAGGSCSFDLPTPLTTALYSLSRRSGATLFMTLLAAFKVLLQRYSGQDDIVVGTGIANRNRGELEGLIGFFVNLLVLRTDLSGNPSFRDVLSRVRNVALDAYEHQDLPFEKLVEELQPDRELSRQPLFQVGCVMQNAPMPSVALSDVTLRPLEIESGTAKFDLMLFLWEGGETITAALEYNSLMFDDGTIRRMAQHFRTLIEGIVADPDQPVFELPLLSSQERQQLLVDWNHTETEYPGDRCVHELFEARVNQMPEADAVVFEQDRLTYFELNRRANRMAHRLREIGVGPEVLVGVCMDRSPAMIVAILAILKAGGAYVPLDAGYPKHRLEWILDHTRAPVIVTASELAGLLPAGSRHVICLDEDAGIDNESNPVCHAQPNNLAYVIYTSGSTGNPKGTLLAHRGLCNLAMAVIRALGISPGSRVLQFASLNFDASVYEIFTALLAGATLCLARKEDLLPGPGLATVLRQNAITTATLPPSILALQSDADLPALTTIVSAGEACSAEIVSRWSSGRRFFNAYGPTEATVCATICENPRKASKPPIGRPIDNCRVFVLDAYLQPVPVGIPGQLYISGDSLARGYLGRPDITAAQFVPDHLTGRADARLYKTGDLCRYLPDGNLEFLGRLDAQIKLRGFRVEPGEIEATLLQHSAVRQAFVTADQDASGVDRLLAYVVPAPDLGRADRQVSLWPSVAEYFVYDELLYYAMTHDERRNASYKAAICKFVNGKTVLDIGTGRDAILARFCLEAGASKVYAVEILRESYEKASALVHELGLQDRIRIIHGDSTKVALPEKIDVCISEIVGPVGSMEGAVPILNDAWRFLKPEGIMIPGRSITRIAAISLPPGVHDDPGFTPVSAPYVEKIFEQVGHRFNVRLCLKNIARSDLISDVGIFEDLDFSHPIPAEYQHEITLEIKADGRLDGFLLWLNLHTCEGETIDILEQPYCWLPTFFPVFYPGIAVSQGDVIEASCVTTLCENGLNPDYRVRGRLVRRDGSLQEFDYISHHQSQSFGDGALYSDLFEGGMVRINPSVNDIIRLEELEARHVSNWAALYEANYSQHVLQLDPEFDFTGWNSSLTGQAIPADEMREWVEQTVQRILLHQPKRVLEIGCGTGLLLLRIAPVCEQYCGTDFSQAAINRLQQAVNARHLHAVRLLRGTADIFDGTDGIQFDAVILNSVVQYFPGVDYVVRIIEQAVRQTAAGGIVFIGDVRSLALLQAFHTSVQLHQAQPSLNVEHLKRNVRRQVSQERELVLDPGFFSALKKRLPQIQHVEIQLKRGRHHNELTQYRYDVILHIGGRGDGPHFLDQLPDACLNWNEDKLSLAELHKLLTEDSSRIFAVRNIPNRRVAAAVNAVELLHAGDQAGTVSHLRMTLRNMPYDAFVDPEDVWSLAEDCSYRVNLSWSENSGRGEFDALFHRPGHGGAGLAEFAESASAFDNEAVRAYANNPLREMIAAKLAPQLRRYLEGKLPHYMVPSSFVTLERLPLTPNGKIDRRALPVPDRIRPEIAEAYVAPRTDVEQRLAQIWSQLLGVDQVGIHDGFFALGGDSILSIQVVARANQAGIRLTPKQLFQYQTIAELAAVANTAAVAIAQQGLVTGTVQLTPVQRWFFEQDLQQPDHFNQALLLQVAQPLHAATLEAAVRHLLRHHDALRLRFVRASGEWQAFHAAEDTVPFVHHDLSELAPLERKAALESLAEEIQAGLDLGQGPLFRLALFELGDTQQRLLIVVHHLIVDGVSWRVLMEDLPALYGQLARREPVSLPAKTTSYQAWAEALHRYAQSDAPAREMDYWLEETRKPTAPLPLDEVLGVNNEVLGVNNVASRKTVSATLGREETHSLLTAVPRAYRTEINDVLLTALSQALAEWSASDRVRIDLDGHGREEIEDGIDVSRTLGWFTSMFPVVLDVPGNHGPGETLMSVKEQLRRVPHRGIGYGLLRYSRTDATFASKLAQQPLAQVLFNYLGQVSDVSTDQPTFRLASESGGATQDPQQERRHLLEISAIVAAGELQVTWMFSENLHRPATIQRLSERFASKLGALIAHCISPDAGGYTPSDFPEAGFTSSELTRFLAGTDARGIEAIYPLAPLQQGLLFHTLYAPEERLYFEQVSCVLSGLDAACFERAWQEVTNRHGILRTSFHWKGVRQPLQVVHERVQLPVHRENWTGLTAAQLQSQRDAFLQSDRRLGFDLQTAPAMRIALHQLGDGAYQFIWSFHHVLLEGWSVSLVLKEVFALYDAFRRGLTLDLPAPRPYRQYVAWLQAQDFSSAETFWKHALRGFTRPTPLPETTMDGTADEQRFAEEKAQVPAETTAVLQSFAHQHQLTLNTLVQGAWALLLSRYSGEDDVLFGATVSGRPPSLRGVEEMVGLFVNTLPVRVKVSPQAMVRVWLSELQMQQVEMRQYEHSPLSDVQAWSEVPQGRPLFETLVIFENYPVDLSLRKQLSGLEIRDFHAVERFNYPLTLFVGAGGTMWLRILYDRRRLSQPDITQLLGHLRETLEALAADPQARLAAILPLMEPQWKQMDRSTKDTAARTGGDGQPGNPVEEALLKVWAETLGIQRMRVDDNFFELGGNSLAAIRLMGRIAAEFSVDLPLRTVFDAPTVAEFAKKNLKLEER